MKWAKRLLIVFVIIVAYWNIGTLYNYWLLHTFYYPNSTVAKVLFPVAPLKGLSLFRLRPEVNQVLKDKYGSFENYYSKEGKNIGALILWPAIFVVVSIAIPIVTWIVWLAIQFWHVVTWTFVFLSSGEALKILHLIS